MLFNILWTQLNIDNTLVIVKLGLRTINVTGKCLVLLFEPLRDGALLFDGQDFFLLLSERAKELLGDTVFFDTLSLRDGGLRLSEEIVDCFSVLVFEL